MFNGPQSFYVFSRLLLSASATKAEGLRVCLQRSSAKTEEMDQSGDGRHHQKLETAMHSVTPVPR